MTGLFTLSSLAFRHLLARWRLLLPLLVGAILAVALLSSTFIYGDAVRQLGLHHALAEKPRSQLDINLLAYYAATDPAAYASIRNEVDVAVSRNIQWFVERSARGMKGSTFFVNRVARGGAALDTSPVAIEGEDAAAVNPRLRAVYLFSEHLQDQTATVAGAMPPDILVGSDSRGRPTSSPEIPVVILEETARRQRLAVGDQLLLVPYWDDALPFGVARIAAIARPKDPGDRYWQAAASQDVARLQDQNFVPLYVSEKTYLSGVGRLFPKMLSDYSWSLMVDPSRIDVRNAPLAEFGLERADDQLRSRLHSYLSRTDLDKVLRQFSTKDLFGRIPLLIVMLMVMAIILYYLVMVANVVVDRHLGEIALLRSRGADAAQVLGLYMWEALALSFVAFIIGPFVAWLGSAILGRTPAFSDLTLGKMLPATLTPAAILMALAGAAVSFAALLAPTIKGLRLDLVKYKAGAARPDAAPFFNRYYLDILIAIIAGLLFWELVQRGSVVSTTLLGRQAVDNALLAAPALILLAVGLLFLRVFPYVMQCCGWVASRFGAAWMTLALWYMARRPLPYALPILLLMLASSIAMFAANFGATVEQSYRDRAAYAVGSDARFTGSGLSQRAPSTPSLEAAGAGPGAGQKSPAYRTTASMALRLFGTGEFDVLAVEPETLGRVAYYRGDFSSKPLPALLGTLDADTPGQLHGLPLPDGASALGVWVMPGNANRNVQLAARIADSDGRYQDYPLGALGFGEWRLLETSLARPPREGGFAPKPPLRLISLHVRQVQGDTMTPGAIYLDSVQASGPAMGTPTILRRFDNPGGLQVIRDAPQSAADTAEAAAVTREGGNPSAVFTWGTGSLYATRGIAFNSTSGLGTPLKAIASRTLLESQRASQGDTLVVSIGAHPVPVQVAEVAEFFPTLDPYRAEGFLVVNLPALMERLNTLERGADWRPSEVWVKSADGTVQPLSKPGDGSEIGGLDRARLLGSYRSDPLVAAGWQGALVICFVAVVFATLMGFAVYSFVQARRRRVEFAMLRSLGLSFREMAAIVLVEQMVIIVTGLALGSWLGVQLTRVLMPFLGLTEQGTQVLPPFAFHTSWTAILITYGIMTAAFLAATAGIIGTFSRMAISKALRFGEV